MSKFRIATIGYIISDWLMSLDESPQKNGGHPALSELKIEPGGICNFLIAGQRLGGQMLVLDAIGADTYGLSLLSILESEGVDVSQVKKIEGARSRAVVVMSDPSGKHEFFPFAGSKLPGQKFSSNWQACLESADALYIDGFALRQEYIHEVVIEAVRQMAESGKQVFFDPGPGTDPASREILPWVHGILLTEEELTRWMPGGANELFDISEKLQFVVVKKGAQGCIIYGLKFSPLTCPAFSVEVIDTMGAGDVFNSEFIVSYLNGNSLHDSGRFANAVGAVKVQKYGAGQNVPTLAEVNQLLQTGRIPGESS